MSSRFIYLGTSLDTFTPELLWLLDDGTDITIMGSVDIGTRISSIAVGSADGAVYVSYGSTVAKYIISGDVLVLDTTWASSGLIAIGATVNEIAVDGSSYLAVAHNTASTKEASLYDATGTLVWSVSLGNFHGNSVEFDADGNLLLGHQSSSNGIVHGRRASRVNGSTLTSFLLADATLREVWACCSNASTSVYFARSTGAGANSTIRKYPYAGGAATWQQDTIDSTAISDIKYTSDGVFVCGNRYGSKSVWKLSDVDGSIVTSIDLGDDASRLDVYPTGEILVASNVAGADDNKKFSLRILDPDDLSTIRGLLMDTNTSGTAIATGPVTATTVTKKSIFVGGTTATVALWKLIDNGRALSCVNNLNTTDLSGANVNSIRVSSSLQRLFVATNDRIIRCYNSSDLTLDTTWATLGVLDLSSDVSAIWQIAVDSNGYLAVACDDTSTPKGFVFLFDNDGIQVWKYQAASLDGGRSVDFLSNGDVLAGFDASSGSINIVRQLLQLDGTLVQSSENSIGVSDRVFGVCVEDDIDEHVGWVWSDSTQPSIVRYADNTLAATWTASLGTNYLYSILILDNSVFVTGYKSIDSAPYYTVWKLNKSDGAILASYRTSATVDQYGRIIITDGINIYVVGTNSLNQDGSTVSVSIFDTDLVYQYGYYTGSALAAIAGDFGTAPTISDQSTDTTIPVGNTLSLYVTATGDAPLSYQWYQDGNPVGTDSSTYTKAITVASDYGTYTCTVTNAIGSDTSADIVVVLTPTISAQTGSSNVYLGSLVTLSVTATAGPSPTYQWYLNDNIIPSATISTYDYYAITTGTYICRVTNAGGYVDSTPIVKTVVPNPYISINPFELQFNIDRT